MTVIDREACEQRDRNDPLARFRDRFRLPAGLIYLDGNSLGPLPADLPRQIVETIERDWGERLIRSWNDAGWIDAPSRVGDRIACLIGARPGEVVAADSTSVNLFKLLAGALGLRAGRKVILTEHRNFPTDLYIMQGLVALLEQGYELRRADADDLADALDEDVAVVVLTHVNYRTARMHDMAALTAAAHDAGALMLWDLAHSVGAVPVDLTAAGVDLAVGCGYKYLNGGPGAPAFLFVRHELQADLRQPLSGWMGHADPFDFESDYRPADGIGRNLCGTPPMLSLIALECALEIWRDVDPAAIREKSIALTELFITLVERRAAGLGLSLASPREPAERGSQVSFGHGQGYAVMQALIARGVIGDFRAPNLLRFGCAPLYLRYVDVFDAAVTLADILASRAWDFAAFKQRAVVT